MLGTVCQHKYGFSQLPKYQVVSRDKCISEVLSYSMSFMSFSPSLFFSPPLCWGLLGLHTAHSQSAHQVSYTHTHTLTHTHIHAPRHSTDPCSTACRLRLPVSASPKTYPEQQWYYSISSRLKLTSSALNPPAEPTHWSATNPGGRQPHSVNSERNWFDSFSSLHLWILVLKYLTEMGLSSSWTDLISFDISSLILDTSQVCRAYVSTMWLWWLCYLALPHFLHSNCVLKWQLTNPRGCINFSNIWKYWVDRLHVLYPLFSNSGGRALFGGKLGNHRNVNTT